MEQPSPKTVFVLISEAEEQTGIDEQLILERIDQGKLLSIVVEVAGQKVLAVRKADLLRMSLDKHRYEQEYGDQAVSFREAGRAAGVASSTIFLWAKKGYIRRGQDGQGVLLADVFYYRDITELRQLEAGGPTNRILDDEGQPYRQKWPNRARDRFDAMQGEGEPATDEPID